MNLGLTFVSALGLTISSMAGPSAEASPWRVLSGRMVAGCAARDAFSVPVKRGVICSAQVKRSVVCKDASKSSYAMEFIAILPTRRAACDELDPAVDFFASSTFDRDENFLPMLRRASKLLRREASRPSVRFRELGPKVVEELTMRQMAALESVEVDTSNLVGDQSYRLVFHLADCQCSAALYLGTSSSRHEWARLIE